MQGLKPSTWLIRFTDMLAMV